jgi:pimeloyl-ACP methyl ester carboxylesterase
MGCELEASSHERHKDRIFKNALALPSLVRKAITAMSKFIKTNHITLHAIERGAGDTTLILMHGLSANAHCFDGYFRAGLAEGMRTVAVDLRGRGLSDKPATGYSMADHARDITGLMDALGIKQAVMGGHSFGALLSIYLAHHYPERVSRLVLIDAAARLHPNVRELVAPSMLRLGRVWPSFDAFIAEIKNAPYLTGRWTDDMLPYYRADVYELPDGSVTTYSHPAHITDAVTRALSEPWLDCIGSVRQPAVLIHADEPYGPPDGDPILPAEFALETVQMMPDCHYVHVPGNHLTMLFGVGAQAGVKAIRSFLET